MDTQPDTTLDHIRRANERRRQTEAMHVKLDLDADDIRQQVALGTVDGFAQIVSDEKLMKLFCHKVYDELAEHARNGTSQWIGKRLFSAVVLFICGVSLTYLLRNGLPR